MKIILPIKKIWFDMILNGIKLEEYREIKPYYTKRLSKLFNIPEKDFVEWLKTNPEQNILVLFRNGYSGNSPNFTKKCKLTIKKGNTEWGAEEDVLYYTFCIEKERK